MNIQRLVNGVTIILLLLSVLLSVLIFYQWEGYSQEGRYSAAPIESGTKKHVKSDVFLGNQSKSIKITQFSEILARPLFTEGRIPDEEPESENDLIQQTGLPKLKLEGVVLSPESRVAVVRDLTDNSILRLSEGMIHSGWRIVSINTAEAILERGDDTHKLPLELVTRPIKKSTTSRFRLPTKKKPAKTRAGGKSP